MLKAAWRLALGVSLVGACQRNDAAPPTPKQSSEVAAAQTDHAVALADKVRADQDLEAAKARAAEADKRVAAAKDAVKTTASNLNDSLKSSDKDTVNGWRGPDRGWAHDWATFAGTTDPSNDKGEYMIQREPAGAITAYRKAQQVSGPSFADMKDAPLAAQVKARLSQDADESLRALDVDAKDHVVNLRGTVKNTDAAGQAVRIALGTPGAEKVVSWVRWGSQ